MDATQRTPRPRSRRWVALVYVLLGLGMTTVEAQASPIRARFAFRASARAEPSFPPGWNQFLSAPELWPSSRTPPFSPLVRNAIWRILDGDPSSAAVNPMIDYLIWRRDLNPFRFDRYHPYLGPRLAQLLTPSADPVVTPPTLAPLTAVPVAPIAPIVDPPIMPLAPLGVPEPSSVILIALVSALGLWRRSRTAVRSR